MSATVVSACRRLSTITTSTLQCCTLPPKLPKIQTPLFLRPPSHTSTLTHLRKWRKWAKDLTFSIGSSFTTLDNGPDATLLYRELNWLLEDVVAVDDDNRNSLIHLLDIDNASLDDNKLVNLKASVDELYLMWKERIENRRPFQYIVGCEHWRDLVLCVQDGVLIPRPETEVIVDLVDGVIGRNKELGDGIWADLGTGSGALAIALARLIGSSGKVIATDVSSVAAAVASYNVERYGLQDKIEIRQGSWFEPLSDFRQKLAGLVSNPPYIPSDHIAGLQAEVGRHEPRLALDGGADGMNDLFHLCNESSSMLKPGGYFAFETNGEKQTNVLADYLKNNFERSFSEIKIVSDFAGIPRFVTGFRSSL